MTQSFQVGANVGEVIGVSLPSLQAPDLGAYGWELPKSPSTSSYAISRGNGEMVPAGDLILRDKPITIHRNESMHRYNHHRPHESLGRIPPVEYRVKRSTSPQPLLLGGAGKRGSFIKNFFL